MRAVVVREWQKYGTLQVSEAERPGEAEGSAVVVEIRAAGCNFFDVLMVEGKYQLKPPRPFVPGSEFAGVVVSAGPDSTWTKGERVYGYTSFGTFAEYITVDSMLCHRIPPGMSFVQAAAFSMTYSTAYAGLVYRARVQRGETVLVHAAAGGVGTAAVQIAKALGATVIATAGSEEKLEVARKAGADKAINYATEDWVSVVKEFTGGRGVDVVMDPVGGDVFQLSTKCVAWDARIVVIGFTSGTIPKVAANRILLKNIAVTGLHWGQYLVHDPPRVVDCYRAISRLFQDGRISPVVMAVYALEELPRALDAIASRSSYGKVVIDPTRRPAAVGSARL